MIEMYGLKIADLGIIKENALIISDLHLGYEEAMEQKGILLPRTLFDLQKKRLDKPIKLSRLGKGWHNGCMFKGRGFGIMEMKKR